MAKSTDIKGVMRDRDYSVDAKDAIIGGTREALTPETKRKFKPGERDAILASIFPKIDCGETPVDAKIIIQKLKIPERIKGGIIRTEAITDADRATVAIAKVVAIGQLAFISGATGKHKYPGSRDPFKVGDLVRVPKMGGQHLNVDGVDFYYLFDDDVHGLIHDLDRVASLY